MAAQAVVSYALAGAALGAALGWGKQLVRARREAVLRIGVPTRHLHLDATSSDLVSRFRPTLSRSAEMTALFERLVHSIDALHALHAAYMRSRAAGAEEEARARASSQPALAHREMVSALNAARRLWRYGTQLGDPSAVMEDDVGELEEHLNGLLRQMMEPAA